MPDPPIHPVKPLREYLFHPLHDFRELKPVRRQDVERKPISFKVEHADFKLISFLCLGKHLGEQDHGGVAPEQGFPVVNAGTYHIPDTPAK
jgi:hypothetical protein